MNTMVIERVGARKRSPITIRIGKLAEGLVGLLLILGVVLMFANVLARHLFAAPFYWAEEVAVYMNVWCVFLGVALVTRRNAHLRMDLVLKAVPARVARVLNTASWLATLLVSAVVVWCSATMLLQLWEADLRSVAIGLPMVVPHLAVFVGFLATFIVAVVNRRRFIDGEVDEVDPVIKEATAASEQL